MTTNNDPPPAPYSGLWHPFLSWTDLFMSIFLWFLLPLPKLVRLPATKDNEERRQTNRKLQETLMGGFKMENKTIVAAWEKGLGQDIVEVTLSIPRQADILKQWNLDDQTSFVQPEGDIIVRLRMPISVCGPDGARASVEKDEIGCRTLDSVNDLNALDAPWIVAFHGGGLTSGSCDEATNLNLTQLVSVTAKQPVVLASVAYSLAPEHVFPTAPAEALTVLGYLFQKMPQRSFHLMGPSAGAYLSTVVGLEVFRKYPRKLASLTLMAPMVDPASDTESFYMNRNVYFVSPEWVRWCWRCYLELPSNENDKNVDIFSLDTLDARLAHGSNRRAWSQSRWRHSKLCRLVDPTLEMPRNLQDLPPTVLSTNTADPLHDEGVKLLSSLRQGGARVQHLDHSGSHCLGTLLDKEKRQEFVQAMMQNVFG